MTETLQASLYVDAWSCPIAVLDSRFTRFDLWTTVYNSVIEENPDHQKWDTDVK